MSAQPQGYQQYMTAEEFSAFVKTHPDGIYEYVDGHLRDLGALLMAGGTNTHGKIAGNILTTLNIALRTHGRRCNAWPGEIYFRANATTRFIPDVSVSCLGQDLVREDGIESPCLVVEVLSTSTSFFDHTTKLETYKACQAIQEYVLVDTTRQFVEVYHRMPNGNMEYSDYREGDTIPLSGLGFDITVADIYYGVSFEIHTTGM